MIRRWQQRIADWEDAPDHDVKRDWLLSPVGSIAVAVWTFLRSVASALVRPSVTLQRVRDDRRAFATPTVFLVSAVGISILLDADLAKFFDPFDVDFHSVLPEFAALPLQTAAHLAGWLYQIVVSTVGMSIAIFTIALAARAAAADPAPLAETMAVIAYAVGLLVISIPFASYLMFVILPAIAAMQDAERVLDALVSRIAPSAPRWIAGRAMLMSWALPWSLVYFRAAARAIGHTHVTALLVALSLGIATVAFLATAYITMTGLI